eukprot:218471_1
MNLVYQTVQTTLELNRIYQHAVTNQIPYNITMKRGPVNLNSMGESTNLQHISLTLSNHKYSTVFLSSCSQNNRIQCQLVKVPSHWGPSKLTYIEAKYNSIVYVRSN